MSQPLAFKEKNKEDFDHYTGLLTEALLKIAASDKLKTTVAELSRITGMHRNTIRQRVWPLERLEAIKESRKLEVLKKRLSKEKNIDPLSLLTDKLEASRLEVLYWFSKSLLAEESVLKVQRNLSFMKDSRDTYQKLMADANRKLLESSQEIDRLRDVISILESAQAEKNT